MEAWHLLYTKPRQERPALENLARQGYESYLPLIRNRRRRRGRYEQIIEPYFPRYLFIHLNDVTDNWGPIRSTIGVSRLIRFGEQPAMVPDSLVDSLRAREDAVGVQDLPPPEFVAGDRVRIAEGAMAGYEGIFKAKTGRERVIILLDIVGNSTSVQLSGDQIEPVR